ncbi:MAG: queuosine precursor transporter [Saprospiraceae bacterium]|nr:queuosine precursor transporter [Saprospiraceae bacterium]
MILQNKQARLFLFLGGFFIANALIAEFIGVKIFSLEQSFGFLPLSLNLFGIDDLSFNLTAGVLLWPVVFVMTDVINEYYGKKGVRILSFMAVVLILYAFFMFFLAIRLVPADFWSTSHISPSLSQESQEAIRSKVSDYNYAFRLVYGQGMWIIVGSLIAFLIGQLLDVLIFHRIKKYTGEKMIWLRATGSTLVSQFVDSFVVLFVAFYIGAGWSIKLVLAIGFVNYIYKFIMAIVLTPLIYLAHNLIERYLGPELAEKLKKEALATD